MLKKLFTNSNVARVAKSVSKRNQSGVVEAIFAPSTFPQEILTGPKTNEAVLPNGIRVVTEARNGETAAVGIVINTGSRNEKFGQNGVARLLQQVNLQQSSLANGSTIVAKTGRENTSYVSECLKGDVVKTISQLQAAIFGKVDAATLEKTKKLYLQKLAKYEDEVNVNIFEALHETAFQGSSMGLPIFGTKETVSTLQQADLTNFRDVQYLASRITVVGVGNVNHDEVVKAVESALSSVPTDKPAESFNEAFPTRYIGSDMRVYNADFPVAHIALGFRGAALTSPDYVATLVISRLLGSWSELDGAASYSTSRNGRAFTTYDKTGGFLENFYLAYKDTGLIGAYLTTPEGMVEDACHHPIAEFVRLSYTVSETELAQAKNKLKVDLLKKYSNSSLATVAEEAGLQVVNHGRRIPVSELVSRIDAVDAATIKRVADKYFFDSDPVLAAIGQTAYVPDYNWLRAWTYRLRN